MYLAPFPNFMSLIQSNEIQDTLPTLHFSHQSTLVYQNLDWYSITITKQLFMSDKQHNYFLCPCEGITMYFVQWGNFQAGSKNNPATSIREKLPRLQGSSNSRVTGLGCACGSVLYTSYTEGGVFNSRSGAIFDLAVKCVVQLLRGPL